MSTGHRVVLSVILFASTCGACATHSLVPMSERPDTRRIWGVMVDSAAVAQTFEILKAALPNEAAVCYQGILRDTLFVGRDSVERRALLLTLTSATKGYADSATEFHVYYSDRNAGCRDNAVASGHSHPHYTPSCDHSDDDANVLFENKQLLVSIAWCMNGNAAFLWQDGRRGYKRWASP